MLLDFALFTSWIEGRLRSAVELAIETQTISGNGTAPNLRGILNTVGIGVAGPPTAGQTAADAIAAGLSLLEADEQAASAILRNPSDYWLMRGVREGTGATAGGYLYGDPAGAGAATLWGVPLGALHRDCGGHRVGRRFPPSHARHSRGHHRAME